MYDIDALEAGIVKIKENIKVLEDAVEKERERIKEYRGMIEALERKQREKALAEKSIKIE